MEFSSVALSEPVAPAAPSSLGTPLKSSIPGSSRPSSAASTSHPVGDGLLSVHQDLDQLRDHSRVSPHVHEASGSPSVADTASPTNPDVTGKVLSVKFRKSSISYLWTYSSTSFGISKFMT